MELSNVVPCYSLQDIAQVFTSFSVGFGYPYVTPKEVPNDSWVRKKDRLE